MDSTLIFIAVIAIVVLITVFSCQKPVVNNSKNSVTQENFTSCPQNPYRPREQPYPNYRLQQEKRTGIVYSEDEDINYHLTNPLVPRITTQPGEKTSWRTFWRGQFMKGNVPEDNNFKGTQIRNYLDSMRYFVN